MDRKEIVALKRMLTPYLGKLVSGAYEASEGGWKSFKAKLDTVCDEHITVGSQIIPLDEIRGLSLIVVEDGKVSMLEDLLSE